MKWSLRSKILSVLSALLLSVVFAYLILANSVFREDKELLIFDTNKFNTERLADELDNSIKRVIDKMEILSQLLAGGSADFQHELAKSVFEGDPELLSIQILKKPSIPNSKPIIIKELDSEKKLQSVGLTPAFLHSREMPQESAVTSANSDATLIENRSAHNAVLYVVRVPVKSAGKQDEKYYVQAVIDGRNWLEYFQSAQSLARIFAVSSDGRIFAHTDPSLVLSHKDMNDIELVREARSQNFSLFQSEFEIDKKNYLGVYRKTTVGALTVISITEKNLALAASRLLLEKTVVLSLIIITTVFLIALLFANTLSTPLLRLVNATREIAKGNFDTTIEVQTHDEIGTLAQGFSDMAKELKSSRLLLEEYNRKLEVKVQERTQELESKNVAIRQQQEVLLKTTRLAAVGEIAGQAAHEVLNPLTAMVSRLESLSQRLGQFSTSNTSPLPVFDAITDSWSKDLAEKGLAGWLKELNVASTVSPGKTIAEEDLGNLQIISQEFKKFTIQLSSDLKLLLSESHRISRIVDGMRGLSRAAKIKRRTDITQLIIDCARVSEDLLRRYEISIDTHFDQSPVFVMIETDEMRQVFSNLIKNSMDAIDEKKKISPGKAIQGQIKIRLSLEEHLIKILFWDNGPGIGPADIDRIFESNFSTKGEAGTGFGLSICRRFVRECGGDLTVKETQLGQFTEFEISLPRLAERVDHAPRS